jgi:hypothetical protein
MDFTDAFADSTAKKQGSVTSFFEKSTLKIPEFRTENVNYAYGANICKMNSELPPLT